MNDHQSTAFGSHMSGLVLALSEMLRIRPCARKAGFNAESTMEQILEQLWRPIPHPRRLTARLRMLALLCGREVLGYPTWLEYERFLKEAPAKFHTAMIGRFALWRTEKEARYESDGKLILATLRQTSPILQLDEVAFLFSGISESSLAETGQGIFKLLLRGCEIARLNPQGQTTELLVKFESSGSLQTVDDILAAHATP